MEAEFFLEQIHEAFPQVKWKEYKLITHGWDHHVIILDNKIVFRMPKQRNENDPFMLKENKNEDGFLDEVKLLDYLSKKVKIDIPVYKYVSNSKSIAGYNIVPGQVLTQSLYHELPVMEKEGVIKQLAEFITTLHSTPHSILKKCHVQPEDQAHEFEKLVLKTESNVFPQLQKEEIKLIIEFFVELEKTLSHKYSTVLVHNNLWGEHILWETKSKQVNVIDFSDRALGDPAIDFVGILPYGAKATKQILNLYSGKKDENMLYRSQLYFKRIPLLIMNGYPRAYKYGYEMFRERFDS